MYKNVIIEGETFKMPIMARGVTILNDENPFDIPKNIAAIKRIQEKRRKAQEAINNSTAN